MLFRSKPEQNKGSERLANEKRCYVFVLINNLKFSAKSPKETLMTTIPLSSQCHLSSSFCKADIRNPLSLLAHERSRFATCQWELLTPTDISIPLTHRLVLYALEAGECLFCVQITMRYSYIFQFAKTVSPLNQPANTHHRPILFSSQSELRLPLL